MNANLLSRLFLAWANLGLRANELERRVEEQATEIFQLQTQLQQERVKYQQAEVLLAQVQKKVDFTHLRLREQLEAVFEGALDAILIANQEGAYVEANPSACQLFGLPRSELLGKQITDFMVPGFDFALAWGNFLELGQATGELSLLRPDGTVREVEYAAKANFLPGQNLSILRDITERKQAEKAWRNSQRFIEQITNTSPTLLYLYDLRRDCNIWANSRSEEFCGCTQKQMQAMGSRLAAEFLHPEDWQQLQELKEGLKVARDGEVIEREYRMKNAQSEWRWLHVWEIVFTRNSDGKPEQILGTAIDVTQAKLAKEELHQREEAFRTLAENSPDLIARFDRQLRHIYVNPAIENSTGMPASAFIGKTNQELGRPTELVSYWNQATQKVFETVSGELIEFDFPTPTGVKSYQSHLVPEYAQDGSVEFVLGVARDITKRKQAERALTQERNFISAILDTVTALIVVLDTQGRIVRFNRACEQMTGYSFDEVRGRHFWDLFLIPEEVESVKAVLNELQAGSSCNEHENYWVARDGSRRLIHWSNTILPNIDREVVAKSPVSSLSRDDSSQSEGKNDAGTWGRGDAGTGNSHQNFVDSPSQSNYSGTSSKAKYIIGCGIDLSDRQQAEKARQALAREQELNQLRTDFFTMASHELRTPLSVILLTVQSLATFYEQWSQEKKLKKLDQIEEAAQNMKHLIDQILTFHRRNENSTFKKHSG
ncbi:MAG: PAS domain S-box protein [Symploca sp. SIO3E6]|nr:PAS domain S-box protein [Caldora sp. SIO3E6]